MVGTLIVDEDGVYEPRSPNDRLLLGMKGTMSEMELSLAPFEVKALCEDVCDLQRSRASEKALKLLHTADRGHDEIE